MDIKNEIKEAYIENKNIFKILAVIFIIGFVLACIMADDISARFMPVLKETINSNGGKSLNTLDIMFHNEKSAFIVAFSSVFFGLIAMMSIFANGFALGFMAGYTIKSVYGLAIYLALIVPHGIIEIPAFFSSCASGILLFLFVLRVIKDIIHKNTIKEAYNNNKKTLKHMIILFLMSIILFAVAALIEGFITPHIGNLVSLLLKGKTLF